MNDLEKARNLINETDTAMASLFEKRMQAAELVAKYKKEHGLPIYDPVRESALLERNAGLIENEVYRGYYVRFLRETMELSKSYQRRLMEGMQISYSGVRGAFAQLAAEKIFKGAHTIPFADFNEAYRAVERGECDVAVLPLENSYNGDVGQVMDLAQTGTLFVNGIYDMEVSQNLLALPESRAEDIRTVISHPQALGQCAEYIGRNGWEERQAVNTAVAAQTVAASGDKTLAAIGSVEAGELYGLKKLEGNIQSGGGNTTRFAVFSRSAKASSPRDNRFVMTFTVGHRAGALGEAVSVIGAHGFNLVALKSRPSKNQNWDYYFFVEGEGNLDTPAGKSMLDALATCCSSVKVLGSFEVEE